ncbi:MAG TPA: thioredoxin domain-containing protein [Solirubrobacteraceae bacterium]|nr:thioredoxin domain-containing protein [Solirubrobacteraceae bacterium]
MPNALAQESSPYLRQHAENPVDWLPWGPLALARAREQDRPLLVSIGYSACHWCHVMERESFEDPTTAALMNECFVCVKVDREERPDVDALYMEAVQGMTGRGGWPLNVFLTPEQLPFYGGTYFPPEPRQGMPAWTQVLQAIAESWEANREELRAGGERLRERLSGAARLLPSGEPPRESALEEAVARLAESFDARHGGFASPPTHAPKFPQAPVLEFLLARGERAMSLTTLHAMAAGGIHDQIGGGFARYSVDATWTVPHFEKMLYDNALLARAYLHGWQLSGDERLLEVCESTLDWALREMRGPEGGFYSALDADSDGVEGAFYVWTVAQLHEILGEDARAAIAWLGATEQGNFQDGVGGTRSPQPGLNVLQGRGPEPEPSVRERIRERLLQARERRPRPALDDKRLTGWNALMICALADASAALARADGSSDGAALSGRAEALGHRYMQAAIACAEFVQGELREHGSALAGDRGRLLRTYNHGQAKIDAFLEDHAFLLEALIALFEASCEERWFHQAIDLADELIARFADPEGGGFFSTASDGEALIVRRKDLEDSPIPSGSSSAAVGLLRMTQLTGDGEYERHALGALALVAEIAPRHPSAFGHMLQAMHWHLAPARPIACAVPVAALRPTDPGGPPLG